MVHKTAQNNKKMIPSLPAFQPAHASFGWGNSVRQQHVKPPTARLRFILTKQYSRHELRNWLDSQTCCLITEAKGRFQSFPVRVSSTQPLNTAVSVFCSSGGVLSTMNSNIIVMSSFQLEIGDQESALQTGFKTLYILNEPTWWLTRPHLSHNLNSYLRCNFFFNTTNFALSS